VFEKTVLRRILGLKKEELKPMMEKITNYDVQNL
jgi:hypothetical protein